MPQDGLPDPRFLKAAQLFEQHLPAYVAALKDNGVGDPILLARVLMHYGYAVVREVNGTESLIDALDSQIRQLRSESASGGN